MSIAVVSLSTPEIAEYAEVAHGNHKAYCERHGYVYIQAARLTDRPPSWDKIPAIKAAFDAGHEWVLWIDADAVFTDVERSLDSLIRNSMGKSLIARADENGINCGVMLFKKCKWSYDILASAWHLDTYINHTWWEQAAFQKLLKQPANEAHVYYVESCNLNAYSDEWQEGDFIYHAVGEPEHKAARVQRAASRPSPTETPVNIWSHSGDRGDLLAALPILAHHAGPHDFCMYPAACTGHRMQQHVANALIPLLEAQPYIRSAYWASSPQGQIMDTWRQRYRGGYNLSDMQTEVFGCGFWPRHKAWIKVPDPKKVARVVIQRSPRYHNWNFGTVWKSICAEYLNEIIFVGHPEEHRDFCTYIAPVPYYPTKDYLELAQVIAGACIFIGNQSSPFWVAEAYKQLTLLEVCLRIQNCHFERQGLIYGVNEYVNIPSRNDLDRLRAENDGRVERYV